MKLFFPNLKNLSFRTKIVLLSVMSVIFTVMALLINVSWQSERYNQDAQRSVNEVTDTNLSNITLGIYNLIEAQGESVQQQVDHNLRVAEHILGESGQVRLSEEPVHWQAINQYNQIALDMQVPKMYVGNTWLGQNRDLNSKTPIIDDIIGMVGGASTMFQRTNSAGDMLRVATSVESKDGKRAIGTYIPAVNPDGTPNTVIKTVLKGETYHGTAYVVDSWYLAAYEPVRDSMGEIIGMLFVGVKQENIQALREAIHEAKAGLSGHVYVLMGGGDKRGQYVISPEGDQDGESALGIKDANGQSPMEAILATAANLGADHIQIVRYPEPAEGTDHPRWIANYVSYYQPWNWVIVSEVYEDELQQYETALQNGRNQMILITSLSGLGIAFMIGVVSYVITRSVVWPLLSLSDTAAQIASGNIELEARVYSQDEVGQLAQSFNRMTSRLRDLLHHEQQQRLRITQTVQGYAKHMERVAQGNLSERVNVDIHGNDPDDPLIVLGQQLNHMTASLQEMIQQVWEAVRDLKTASAEILAATTQQVGSASEQSTSVGQTTTTVDEVRAIAEQNSLRSQEVANAAQRTMTVSQSGQQAIHDTIESMTMIKNRVQSIAEHILILSNQATQIGAIITTVSDIAAQSNMLALNAAVEAARAGEHGRGFSVVALEVRRLAEQSKNATVQVKTILSEIQKAISTTVMTTEDGAKGVALGVQRAEQSGEAIERLTQAIEQSAQTAMQVVAGGQQQTGGMEQIAQAIHHIEQAATQGLVGTRQAENSAQNLDALAQKLTAMIEQYQL